MNGLKGFASFIRHHKLDEMVQSELQWLYASEAPILQYINHLGREELLARTSIRVNQFLVDIEEGTSLTAARQSLEKWENDPDPEIPKAAISLVDVELIQTAQKMALIKLLPAYTQDVAEGAAVLTELMHYYSEVQLLSIRALEKVQEEERRRLREAEEKYKDLFDNATDMVHMAGPDGMILYVNNAWLHNLGYSLDELKGTSIYDYISPQDRERFRSYRACVLGNPDLNRGIEMSFVSRAGTEVFVEGSVSCKFSDGVALYTQGILHNITSRRAHEIKLKQINEQLQDREESLVQLIRHAPDAVIVIDEKGIIVIWNPKAEEIFGWTAEETIGTMLSDTIIPPAYREAHNRGIARLLATGEPRLLNKTIELTALNKGGAEFYIALTLSQSTDRGKALFISFIRDIDQQKRNNMELDRKREELVKTNNELEQYAWLTSHDLKEPVRKILTFSDMLLGRHREHLDPATVTTINKIRSSAKRMTGLIDAILLYSSISGARERFVDTNLATVLYDVITSPELPLNEYRAAIKVEPTLPVIKADPVQMRLLFQHLILNAIMYGVDGREPEVHIRGTVTGRELAITVTDNGQGFDNMYADRIFRIFQRLVSREQYEGTGMGLALCRKIVEHHGGRISAASEPGVGSVFEVVLPLL